MHTNNSRAVLLAACLASLYGCGKGGSGSAEVATASPESSSSAVSSSESASSIGSSDESTASSSSPEAASYTVYTTATAGGEIAPKSQAISAGSSASFAVTAAAGYSINAVTGCTGSFADGIYVTAAITASCTVEVSFTANSYSVAAHATQGGSVTPSMSSVGYGGVVQVTVSPEIGYELGLIGGCSGALEGNVFATGAITESCEVQASFRPISATVSGTLQPTSASVTDSDLNDLTAYFEDNSVPSSAQALHHLAVVQGFASAEPTLGDITGERFALTADRDDFFEATLEAGQVLQLQVVDFNGRSVGGRFEGDLDLYLLDESGSLRALSEGTGEHEVVTVPASATYKINVHAHMGVSKYILRLLPPSGSAATASTTSSEPPLFVPNEMIVKFVDNQTVTVSATKPVLSLPEAALLRAPKLAGLDLAGIIPGRALDEIRLRNPLAFDQIMTLRSVKTLRQRPDVVYAEPNYVRQSSVIPNDPHYKMQWHYAAIGLPQAWDTTTGATAGAPVIVAVLDTGVVLHHPDFSGRLVGGYDFIASAERARDGNGIDSNPDDPGDSDTKGASSWHGTHVAGTVAAASNNSTGGAGVAWNAMIMPIRVLGKGGGTSYDIIQGVRYASGLPNDSGTVPLQRADILNLSFGGTSSSKAEKEAYQAARAAGVILVAAAGNAGNSNPFYPAAYAETISVSATDYANVKTYYSSYGPSVTLAAPGGDGSKDLNKDGYPDAVLSTFADDSRGSIRPSYSFSSGTSMAAPHVAGVLALMKALHPMLAPHQVDQLIQSGSLSDDIGAAGRDDYYGYGLVNAVKAVQVARDLAAGGEMPAEPAPLVVASPDNLSLGFSATGKIQISNQGGGEPKVFAYSASEAWLEVSPNSVDLKGLGSYSVTVNRTGLAGGSYRAVVTFIIDDGTTLTVAVSMQVDSAAAGGALPPVHVLLRDTMTGNAVAATTAAVLQDGSLAYAFDTVPNGTYFIVAGTDIDADRVLCRVGEICGGYTSVDSPTSLVVGDSDLSGISFSINLITGNAPNGEPYPGISR